ncbi:hypothetical protein MMC22_009256 [Lobaria immixta]|nr:hypothetical protein [Lobaria immixta]
MSTSLTALPAELIRVVVNLVSQPTSLCNLARCSRQLYFCTVPRLYRDIFIQEEVRTGEQQDEQLKNLASLLIRRPDLTEHVRYFTLQVRHDPRTGAKYKEDRESEEYVSPKMLEVDQVFTFSEEEKISCLGRFSRTHKSYYDFILALLLPTMLRLEKLMIDLQPGYDTPCDTNYLEQMLQRIARTERQFGIQPPFEALTFFHHDDQSLALSTGFIASLLKLPAIQRIFGSFQSTWDHALEDSGVTDKNLIELESSSSPLTYLDLCDYRLSIADFGHIIRAPKALKTLYYNASPSGLIRFPVIRDALGPQENCLEIFDLNSLDDDYWQEIDFGPMPSFTSFKTLKVFRSAASCLAANNGTEPHTQKSPQQIPSLKRLILEDADYSNPLFDEGVSRPAKLTDVLWKDTQETAIGRLIRVGAAQGVSVDVIEDPTDETDEDSNDEW